MRKILAVILSLICLSVKAEKPDSTVVNVSNAFMLEVGSAHRADTYLTPLHYSGWCTGLRYNHSHNFSGARAFWTLDAGLLIDRTLNPVRNASMLGMQFELRWSALRSWKMPTELPLAVGICGATTVDAGALYLSRNGNNPVAANASWTVDVTAYGSARLKLGRIPATVIYRADLPVLGAMFAPDYGQLYYEIYLGDRRNIFSGAWWGRYFRLDQTLTLDLKLASKSLRLGYGCDILSTKVHDIVSRRVNHVFIVGLTTDWLTH